MDNISPPFELLRFIDVTATGGSKPVAVSVAEPMSVAYSNAHGGLRKVVYTEARKLGETAGTSLANAIKQFTL